MKIRTDEKLPLGLLFGVLFGFLLQKGGVLRYDKQVAALRFRDMTIVKFMFSAIMVATVMFHWLKDLGQVKTGISETSFGTNVLGGLTFGAGWGLLGYCPGTGFGAAGEGRWDAVIGLLGMLTGASIYAEVFPSIKDNVLRWVNVGQVTLPEALHVNQWQFISGFLLSGLAIFGLIEKKGL